ncbi:MAG TPA: IPTL-CTERM sorting domain-containing protein [Thermoanaerobaculia bacterium]|nr:IPTL-CTERM sorting domain-containing protein [Thermoanaerobaculia bacterium]
MNQQLITRRMRRIVISALSLCLAATSLFAQPVAADVVTVGTVTTSGNVVNVPVYIRDVSGTPLGIDQPAGSRIQSFSIKVNYAPASAVQSVTFTRAGITAPLTPTFENSPQTAGSVSLLDTFAEATNLIPFTSNAGAPGDYIGTLHFVLASAATPGTTIALTLDPVLTQLTDEGGSPATRESVGGGNLVLVAGAINVTAAVPTLSTWALALLAAILAFAALRLRIS